ncbi:MAG: 7-cyano-7-deazaguanine synthase, partial [bacterium]|nr:7-cyano-7-deazaguanine synthase [bacterium]
MQNHKPKIVIAMSGGVDSSTAAVLMKQEGYEVIGITMRLWSGANLPDYAKTSSGKCCGIGDVDDARRVAAQLGIPFYVMNYEKEFKQQVIDYFCKEYVIGRTPNPCILCNQELKFNFLLKKAEALGIEQLATGHYARIEFNKKDNR